MIRSCAIGVTAVGLIVAATVADAQSPARYRDFQLGGDIASVTALTGAVASDAKTIHTRPALLQDLEWRRPYAFNNAEVDPVEQIAFSFYNNQLFRLLIDYDRSRTEGMTDGDMIDALSTMYGAAKAPVKTARAPIGTLDEESGTRVATWGGADFSAVLYRSSYASGFRLIVTSVKLSALARTATAQALRLDERDAPLRERARQKKEADDERVAKEKARQANKAVFKP
ncbi:MAG TPA: hypothetical protein VFA59_23540 [Vicinamibacterales bacterium]|nr:hypothetical protein [Vicinamibacterales bacterium]